MGLTKVSKVLNAVNQEATMWVEGQSKVGIAITSMTGTNTVSFYGSQDGISYSPLGVGAYPSANPPSSQVTSASATGNWEASVLNYKFIRAKLTSGSGPVTVIMAASVDGGYQEAFANTAQGVSLAVVYPSTTSSAGANTMTIPAQSNRAINLTFLEVSMAGPGGGSGAQLRIWDGSVGNGAPLYSCYLAPAAGSVGTVQKINIPEDADGKKGIQASAGNPMVIQIINLGGVSAIMNARVSYL